jgi:hypothetical protein
MQATSICASLRLLSFLEQQPNSSPIVHVPQPPFRRRESIGACAKNHAPVIVLVNLILVVFDFVFGGKWLSGV